MILKRLFLFLSLIFFIWADSAFGDDKPFWWIGLSANYAAASEYLPSPGRYVDTFMTDTDAGSPGFSISATRMAKPWFGIGGEIMAHIYHWTSHPYGIDIGDIYWPKPGAISSYSEGPSGTDVRLNYLFNTFWIARPSATMQATFLLGCGAYCYSEAQFGFHGGILARYRITEKKAFLFGARVHLIPNNSELGALVQLTAGLQFGVTPPKQLANGGVPR